jgi:hypothetical protein
MRETLVRLFAILAFVAGFASHPLAAEEDGLNWLGDYPDALRQAKQTHKPLFVEFRCEA